MPKCYMEFLTILIILGLGSSQHVEYNVHIAIGGDSPANWTIMRRYRQFRDLHRALIQAYGNSKVNIQDLTYP